MSTSRKSVTTDTSVPALPWPRLAAVAAFAAWTSANLDVAASLRPQPGGLSDPATLLQVLGLSFLAIFACLLPVLVASRWVAARVSQQPIAVAGAVHGVVVAACLWLPAATAFHVELVPAGRPTMMVAVGAVALCILTILVVAWLATLRPPRSFAYAKAGAFVSTAVLVLAARLTFPAQPALEVPKPATQPSLRGVVLISIDTLRADALSIYSKHAPPTPHIDALARQSLIFEHAQTLAPWTRPSVATLLTGLSPAQHGILGLGERLHAGVDTLAERFLAGGYHTAAIAFNPMLRPAVNFSQGFVSYEAFPRGSIGTSWGAKLAVAWSLPVRRDPVRTPELTDRALSWLSTQAQQPFFLWLHYLDPHQPYEPPARYMPKGEPPRAWRAAHHMLAGIREGHMKLDGSERAWVRGLYDGEVRGIDDEIGRLVDALKALGVYDDVAIVLTSDHGEEFWEHQGFEHGHTLYEELLHVPLLVKLPRSTQTGRVAPRVSLAQVYPTLLDLAGLPQATDGRRRPASLIGPEPLTDRDVSFVSQAVLYYQDRIAVTRNDKKYVLSLASRKEEIFDLQSDPLEQRPLPDQDETLRREARAALRAELRAQGADEDFTRQVPSSGTATSTMDPATVGNLRALGYVQ